MKKKSAAAVICLLFCLLLVLLSAGCFQSAKSPSTPAEPAKEPSTGKSTAPSAPDLAAYFPMTVGSTWQYQGEGNEYASFKREVIFAASNKGQLKEDNGGTVSAQVFQVDANSITRVFFQGEEYNSKNFLQSPANDSTVILKTPLQVGTQWQDGSSTRKIVDTAAQVKTPAGVFENCIKVEIAGSDGTVNEYYKKGVGMVKREFISGDAAITSTLASYSIAK